MGKGAPWRGPRVWKASKTRNPPSPGCSLGLALQVGTAWVAVGEKRWCSHMEAGRGWGLWAEAIWYSDCSAARSLGLYALSCAKLSPRGWSPCVSRGARRDRRFLRWPPECKVRVAWAGDDPSGHRQWLGCIHCGRWFPDKFPGLIKETEWTCSQGQQWQPLTDVRVPVLVRLGDDRNLWIQSRDPGTESQSKLSKLLLGHPDPVSDLGPQ